MLHIYLIYQSSWISRCNILSGTTAKCISQTYNGVLLFWKAVQGPSNCHYAHPYGLRRYLSDLCIYGQHASFFLFDNLSQVWFRLTLCCFVSIEILITKIEVTNHTWVFFSYSTLSKIVQKIKFWNSHCWSAFLFNCKGRLWTNSIWLLLFNKLHNVPAPGHSSSRIANGEDAGIFEFNLIRTRTS